eukprot:CAMPEP_0204380042 /NCGR_PEP_ID=MMETSP0469-20131031/53058_1 /ASSEMBLY_ACC=CAM_ASM_000384 /TAXON_ID=2969 /ORGANISM="Oxyrrhis marina" /LENGTH=35 /DNA_ID= /DNA_START= /DNA_END= /DNA_ORIENTATION=
MVQQQPVAPEQDSTTRHAWAVQGRAQPSLGTAGST